MKKSIFMLPVTLLGLLSGVFISCESDDDKKEEVCTEFAQVLCEAPEEATTCCDSDGNCYFNFLGNRYDNTPEGREQLNIAMCGELESTAKQMFKNQLKAHTMKLLNEAKVCSLCE